MRPIDTKSCKYASPTPLPETLLKNHALRHDTTTLASLAHFHRTAEADGTVSLYQVDNSRSKGPLATYDEHAEAAVSVSYNLIDKGSFASASLDGTVKLWDGDKPCTRSLATFPNDGKGVWEVHFR